jgi:hypothetical protein
MWCDGVKYKSNFNVLGLVDVQANPNQPATIIISLRYISFYRMKQRIDHAIAINNIVGFINDSN